MTRAQSGILPSFVGAGGGGGIDVYCDGKVLPDLVGDKFLAITDANI